MTREDQITIASYSCGLRGSCADFEAGAKWADANPKQGLVNLSQVWHDADEEPYPYKDLLVENEKGGHAVHSWYNESYGWKSFADIFQLRHWAYIDDLLPKGGE